MGTSISQSELLDRLEREVNRSPEGRCACTLVMGSGFSYPIIPTTTQIVREDLPWFVWCHASKYDGPKPKDFSNEERREALKPEATEHAKAFWARVHEWAKQPKNAASSSLAFELDADGLPDRSGIANAYMAAFSTDCPHGLATEDAARRFLAELVKKARKRLNPAHLYLASLMSERPNLFRTIFTTNFDPLLQRALQLVNMPYFVSDRPDVMQHPDDDGEVEALHLVHVHGSIYRYLLLNTPEDIKSCAERNQPLLQEYFRKHAVLIIGYGGWDDAITRALAKVERFARNLYWCDRAASLDQSGISERGQSLLKARSSAFYVPIDGADSLLVALHQRLTGHALPRLFRDPIKVVQEQFDTCDLTGMKVARVEGPSTHPRAPKPDDSVPGSGLAASSADLLDLGQEQQNMRARLECAQQAMTGNAAQPDARLAELIALATDNYFGPKPESAMSQIEKILELLPESGSDRAVWLRRRGVVHAKLGRRAQAINDYTAVIKLSDSPVAEVAKALVNRGILYGKLGRTDDEIADFNTAVELSDAPAEAMAHALINRGHAHGRAGRTDQEINDYGTVISLPGAPAWLVAHALVSRATAYERAGRIDEAIADNLTVVKLHGASEAHIDRAILALARLRNKP